MLGSESIWESINVLNPDRIGHGVSAVSDIELQEYLIEKNIALECCISANQHCNITSNHHPVIDFYRTGVPFSINSDNPGLIDTNIALELIKAAQIIGLTIAELTGLVRNSIEHSFLTTQEKNSLILTFNNFINK